MMPRSLMVPGSLSSHCTRVLRGAGRIAHELHLLDVGKPAPPCAEASRFQGRNNFLPIPSSARSSSKSRPSSPTTWRTSLYIPRLTRLLPRCGPIKNSADKIGDGARPLPGVDASRADPAVQHAVAHRVGERHVIVVFVASAAVLPCTYKRLSSRACLKASLPSAIRSSPARSASTTRGVLCIEGACAHGVIPTLRNGTIPVQVPCVLRLGPLRQAVRAHAALLHQAFTKVRCSSGCQRQSGRLHPRGSAATAGNARL